MRVLDETGNNLGVMSKEAAFYFAREKELDLIEISPLAQPPVARIMSFDKYRYQQGKKEKNQRVKQKGGELKQVQISVGEARHDLEHKAQKIEEFFEAGNIVEILLVLKGRQKANKDWAKYKLSEFLKILPEHQVLLQPRFGGKGFSLQISKPAHP